MERKHTMKKYSIIIPTYNKCDEFLKPCVESILKNSKHDEIEICISANGCKDNTLEYLRSTYSQYPDIIRWVWSDEPLGYSKATNKGIKIAQGEFVVLLNNDTQILDFGNHNEWLERLNQPFSIDDDVGITGVLTEYNEIINMDFLIFLCVMMRRSLFKEIGHIDTDFRIGGREDIEFCYRTVRAGYKLIRVSNKQEVSDTVGMFTTDFPIYHLGEGTVFDKSLVDVDFVELRKEHNDLLFKKTRLPIPKRSNRPKIILKHTYAGLGDNLCHSTLPEIYTKRGYDVYVSIDQEYRNPEVKTLIDMNPYIKGYTARKPNVNIDEFLKSTYSYDFWNKSYHARIEQALFGVYYNEHPKIYYSPIFLPEWHDKTFVDLSSFSNPYDSSVFLEYAKNNNINVVVQGHDFQTKNIFEYINIIYSCHKFICMLSGGNSLSSAINKRNTECYLTKEWIEHIKNVRFYHFNNINYICPTNPELSIINVL